MRAHSFVNMAVGRTRVSVGDVPNQDVVNLEIARGIFERPGKLKALGKSPGLAIKNLEQKWVIVIADLEHHFDLGRCVFK